MTLARPPASTLLPQALPCACVLEGSELTLPTMWCTLPINPQKKKARDASHHKKAAPVWQSYQNSIDTADSASAEGITANMRV